MPTAVFPVTVFLHFTDDPENPEEEFKHEKVELGAPNVVVAEALTRGFYSGMIYGTVVWNALPKRVQARIKELEIDEGLAVSGAVSVSKDSLALYAPDLA